MKIGYIGRLEILDLLIKSEDINKLDIHYKSIQENLYNLNLEIVKLYKITSLDTVYIDYACIENDQDAVKILKSAMAVRYNVKFNIIVSDRKLFNKELNILNLKQKEKENKADDLQAESEKLIYSTKKENKKIKLPKISSFNLPKFKIPKIKFPKSELKNKQKIGERKLEEEMLNKLNFETNIKPLYSKESIEKEEKLTKKTKIQIKIPKAINFDFIKKIIYKDKNKESSKKTKKQAENMVKELPGITPPKVDIVLEKQINIFFSTLELQGTSYIINSLKNNNTAIVDLDLSFAKYTDCPNMEDYIDKTYINSENPKKNALDIYTTENNILSLIRIIKYLGKYYGYILVDSNSLEKVESIRDTLDVEVYMVVSEDYKNIRNVEYYDNTNLIIINNHKGIDIRDIENITNYPKENILKVG